MMILLTQNVARGGWPWYDAFLKVSGRKFKPQSEKEVVLRKLAWIVGFHLGQGWFGEKVTKSERSSVLLFLFHRVAELGIGDLKKNASG